MLHIDNPLAPGLPGEFHTWLSAVIDSVPGPLAHLDAHLTHVHVNRAYAQALNRAPADLIGHRYSVFFPHADDLAPFERARRAGEPVEFQPAGFAASGRVTPVMDAGGRVLGFVVSLAQGTSMHERLAALRAADRAILRAGSEADIALAVLPHVARLVPCHRAGVLLFDVQKGEGTVLGVQGADHSVQHTGTILSLHPAWDLERLGQGQMQLMPNLADITPRSPFLEEMVASGLGPVVHVPLIAAGELLGVLSLGLKSASALDSQGAEIARDMADQLALGLRQARLQAAVKQYTEGLEQSVAQRTAALKASEARFRTIFEDAAVGIALIDKSSRIVASNPALQRILGYSDEELRGRTFADFTHPDDLGISDELHQELVAGKLKYYHVDKRYLRRDGSIVWARPTVSIVHASLSPLHAVKMVEDITEQKKAQEALIKAEKLRLVGRLGASLAHEINNPLQTVIGCLGLASESLAGDRDPSRYLEVARDEVHRTARIVAQLRNLHRRTDYAQQEMTDLNALLASVGSLLRQEADNRRVTLVLDLDDNVPPLLVMPDLLRQVFMNVVLNAIESMLDGGLLTLRTQRTQAPDGVRVSIVDQGEGIPEQNLADLFDPFYTTKPDGLGLGLYVSRHVVLDHHGEITINSEPGRGTTVSIWLPLAP